MTEKITDTACLSSQIEFLSITEPKEDDTTKDRSFESSSTDECSTFNTEDTYCQTKQEKNCSSSEASEYLKHRDDHLNRLRGWINHRMTIEMTDGRVLIGTFLCTDRDANVILGSCGEYLSPQVFENKEENGTQEARLLGLVMVPGQHIVNILHDQPNVT